MKTAIFTGSFDPVTRGHVCVAEAAARDYDRLYVVALQNADKDVFYPLAERKRLLALALAHLDNVTVDAYDGLTADYMHAHGITEIVRGVRNENDRTAETALAGIMHSFDPAFTTRFYEVPPAFAEISSTRAREAITAGKPLDEILPDAVANAIIKK